jgi:hypothetical protein
LNAANNVNAVAAIDAVLPDAEGIIEIALAPGPNNNNANHFTYLGVLQLETDGAAWVFDFGAVGSPTPTQGSAGVVWNDVTPAVGATDDGALSPLLSTNGAATTLGLSMISRFNGANSDGAASSGIFPASATRDSLFGNAEVFGGLADVTPEFELTGLDRRGTYALTFYASRAGVGDNRQTRYTAAGAATNSVELSAANNTNEIAVIEGLRPGSNGEIRILLSPGESNNSANHFTYLGVLRLDWVTPPRLAAALRLSREGDEVRLQVMEGGGGAQRIEASADLLNWTPAGVAGEAAFPATGTQRFFRAVED